MAVFKKNGNWWIDTYVNGRRVRRKIGPNKRTAELAEQDLKVRAARGEWLGIEHTKRVKLSKYCQDFLGRLTGRAPNTVTNYEVACRVHFIPAFGDQFLSDIRPKHIEDYQQGRAKEAKFSTVNQELVLLSAIFKSAVTRGYVKENPVKQVKPLRLPEKEPPFMTREQVAKLYGASKDWLYTFVAIALNTGLRVSEVCSLRWKDIEVSNRVIKVRNSETFTTKSKRNRILPINAFLVSVLKKAPRHIKNPHVIFTSEGGGLIPQSVNQRFTRLLKTAGLPHFRVHDLRHTFGTTLAADGVDVVTIQKLMGHSDIKTTMRYLHAAPDRMQWAVENLQLDGTIKPKNKETVQPGGPYLDTGARSA